MKFLLSLIGFIIITSCHVQSYQDENRDKGRLRVTENGHFLQYEDGTPFFWLGDTGWYLFKRLKKEEIENYLENRRKKGFNVIQAAILRGDLTIPNQYGDIPFEDLDPAKPNEGYFELIDWTINNALEKKMFIGLLPTWGDQVSDLFGTGSIRFDEKSAHRYGLYLGQRYKDYPNIIWILGGDQPAFSEKEDWRPIWRSMIKGIREGTSGNALVTYHPWGETSTTDFWHDEDILDFNMLQSGHARSDIPVWEWINRDFNLMPIKPILDGEPNYEDHPINWKPENGYFRDYDVRKQIYRSVFAGGLGVTYGHQAIRQFYSTREKPMGFPDRFWTEALDQPGAFQAGYLKKLILSRPSMDRFFAQSIIKSENEGGSFITAFIDKDKTYCMIYMPIGKEIEVDLDWINANKIKAWWYNPQNGKAVKSEKFKNPKIKKFIPPSTGMGNDWVLIIEDARRNWSYPEI